MSRSIPVQMHLAEELLVDRNAGAFDRRDVRSLTAGIARGEERAFNVFYEEYSPRLYRLLIVVTGGDEVLSRELHQAVMIKAAQKLKVMETESQLWAWLAAVARNQWRDICRKRQRDLKVLTELAATDAARASQATEHLERALAMLTDEERQLVENFYLDSVPQVELARRNGRTVKAVQCALARIRKKLKEFTKREAP